MEKEYVEFIDKYYEQAKIVYEGLNRETGEDYIYHPINVAYILASLKMDPITIGCALIHEAISLGHMTYEEIEEMFGSDSANIVSSISKISNIFLSSLVPVIGFFLSTLSLRLIRKVWEKSINV